MTNTRVELVISEQRNVPLVSGKLDEIEKIYSTYVYFRSEGLQLPLLKEDTELKA